MFTQQLQEINSLKKINININYTTSSTLLNNIRKTASLATEWKTILIRFQGHFLITRLVVFAFIFFHQTVSARGRWFYLADWFLCLIKWRWKKFVQQNWAASIRYQFLENTTHSKTSILRSVSDPKREVTFQNNCTFSGLQWMGLITNFLTLKARWPSNGLTVKERFYCTSEHPCTYATNLHMIVVFFVSYDRSVVHVFLNPSELHAHCTS